MQRARLYLEGNSNRVVRIEELARLANFSSWYRCWRTCPVRRSWR
jgi:AraC family transcriptional regulator